MTPWLDKSDDHDKVFAAYMTILSGVQTVVARHEADAGTYTYKYAQLPDIFAMLDPLLDAQGCVLSQTAITDPPTADAAGRMRVVTNLLHQDSGQWMIFDGPSLTCPNQPQAAGSMLTYLRRYVLVTTFKIPVSSDDDGAQAQRAIESPGHRTGAENEARSIMGRWTREQREAMRQPFVDQFGSGLADLDESRHGEVLAWIKQWESSDAHTTAGGSA